ncbi:MAG: hypothetical protein QXQ14_02195 [Candidatus Aenigmatarchaeota archaeon]
MISFEAFQAIKNSIVLFFLARFSVEDLKTTEIKDFEAYLFFSISILFFLLEAFLFGIEKERLLSILAFNLIAVFLYLFGQWGAGDSAILMSLGFVLNFTLFYSFLNLLFIFSLGIAYSFFYSLVFAIVKKKDYILLAILPLLFLISSILFISSNFILSLFLFLGFLYSSLPFMIKVQKDFIKKVSTKNLKEGDVLYDFKIWRGITKEELEKLRKTRKFVYVKEGIRYAPTFLIYFVILILLQFYKIEAISMQPSLEQFLHVLQNLF